MRYEFEIKNIKTLKAKVNFLHVIHYQLQDALGAEYLERKYNELVYDQYILTEEF